MPSSTDMQLKQYFQWCYDCDKLIETWLFDSPSYAGHSDCRNIRTMGMPEIIDEINKKFKSSAFRNEGFDNAKHIARHKNLCFIKDLMDNYDMKSGNEDMSDDMEFARKQKTFVEDGNDPPSIERIKARRNGVAPCDFERWQECVAKGESFHASEGGRAYWNAQPHGNDDHDDDCDCDTCEDRRNDE